MASSCRKYSVNNQNTETAASEQSVSLPFYHMYSQEGVEHNNMIHNVVLILPSEFYQNIIYNKKENKVIHLHSGYKRNQ